MMEEESVVYFGEDSINQSLLHSSTNRDASGASFIMSALKPRHHATMTKKQILKNIIVLDSSMFVFFLAFQSLQNLQSTMNSAQGIGMESMAIVFASSMLSCVFLPDLLIKTFGVKRTGVVMFLCGIPYLISNFNPTYQVIIPASVLMGIVIGPMNTAAAFYVNEMAFRYFKAGFCDSFEVILAKFFGLLSFFLESTQIWGNLISYFVLKPGTAPISVNGTEAACGVNFIKDDNSTNPNLQPPTDEQRYVLISIFIVCAAISGALMGLFMDKLENDVSGERIENKCRYIWDRLMATAQQAMKLDQVFLLPMTVLCGMELAFYTGDFTEAYIACSWGVHHVGFVTVCFGVCGALMSLLVGPLVKCISQMAVFILAAVANVSICIVLFLWDPSPQHSAMYFVIAGVWGMGDAIWWSQVTALYGLMFPNDREAAFSNLYFWSFLGFFISYSYANYFSVTVKINILLCVLLTGMMGYMIGQIKVRCSTRREYVSISENDDGQ